jgi:DNA-binding NtrC family response regulator
MRQPTKSILHVDDDRLILQMTADQLHAAGFEVVSLSEPRQAISTLLEENLRLVLLDIEMPHLNGLELLRQIKQFDGGVQVIMLTSLVSTTSLLESMRCGAEACFFKPLADYTPLVEAVSAACEKVDRWWTSVQNLSERKKALEGMLA